MSGEGFSDQETTPTDTTDPMPGGYDASKVTPSQDMIDKYGPKTAKYFNPDGSIRSDIGTSKFAAAIARDQYLDYQSRFKPLEDIVMTDLADETGKQREIQEATGLAGSQFDKTMGMMGRNFERYGVNLNPAQKKSLERNAGMNRSLAQVTAANTTRRGIEDRDLGSAENMVSLGRNLASDTSSMIGEAAGMGHQRRAANQGISTANSASNMQAYGQAAGLAMAAAAMFA